MSKVVSNDIGRFYHHYPKVAAVITAEAGGRRNAMSAAWHTSLSFAPPLYGVSISPRRFTYQLIVESKEFGVNFLPTEAAALVASVGGCSGREVDKFQRFNIATDKPVKTAVPVLKDAYAAYECRLIDDRGYGDHRWLVGEILAVHLMEGTLTTEDVLDLGRVSPTLYLGNELYITKVRDTVERLDRKVYGKGGQ